MCVHACTPLHTPALACMYLRAHAQAHGPSMRATLACLAPHTCTQAQGMKKVGSVNSVGMLPILDPANHHHFTRSSTQPSMTAPLLPHLPHGPAPPPPPPRTARHHSTEGSCIPPLQQEQLQGPSWGGACSSSPPLAQMGSGACASLPACLRRPSCARVSGAVHQACSR